MSKAIVTIHGITARTEGYSKTWYRQLFGHDLENKPEDWYLDEIYWDFINNSAKSKMLWSNVQKISFIPTSFLFDMLPDAISYRFKRLSKEAIEYSIKRYEEIAEETKCEELFILAHSLGSVLAFHSLQTMTEDDHPLLSKIRLVTFGTPLTTMFQRWWLKVENTPIKLNPKYWINLHGDFRDLVGGRELKNFSVFDAKNNFKFDVPHNEITYLKASKNTIIEFIQSTSNDPTKLTLPSGRVIDLLSDEYMGAGLRAAAEVARKFREERNKEIDIYLASLKDDGTIDSSDKDT